MVLDHSTKTEDIEHISESASVLPPDPFHFREALKSEKQLQQLRQRNNKSGKKISKYYAKQNSVRPDLKMPFGNMMNFFHQLIASLLKSMEDHTSEAQTEEKAARLPVCSFTRPSFDPLILFMQVKIAIWASLIANLSLCVLQSMHSSSHPSFPLNFR